MAGSRQRREALRIAGKHSLLPPRLTGLCCHGNMLWRSTYWDSDSDGWRGWWATALAVRGFGLVLPRSEPCLSESHSTAELPGSNTTAMEARHPLFPLWICVSVCVWVCSRNAAARWTFLSSAYGRRCASALMLISPGLCRFPCIFIWKLPAYLRFQLILFNKGWYDQFSLILMCFTLFTHWAEILNLSWTVLFATP